MVKLVLWCFIFYYQNILIPSLTTLPASANCKAGPVVLWRYAFFLKIFQYQTGPLCLLSWSCGAVFFLLGHFSTKPDSSACLAGPMAMNLFYQDNFSTKPDRSASLAGPVALFIFCQDNFSTKPDRSACLAGPAVLYLFYQDILVPNLTALPAQLVLWR